MTKRSVGTFIQNSAAMIAAGAMLITGAMPLSVEAAPAARPIISGGTIKTPDGQLLRGCHAHILRNVTSAQTLFFTNRANVQRLKDQAHMNLIRICFITPGWGGAASPDDGIPIADSIIANCESVGGVYAIVNYHGPVGSGVWDLNAFWDKMAQRYKDKTCVLFGAVNELFQDVPTGSAADWPTSWMADLYKNHMRKWAPNTMIMGLCEPVHIQYNWGPYMRDLLGPAAGINWAGGKDCFSFHAYGGTAANIIATRSAVPTMLSEFSFSAEGWTQLNLGGYSMPAEWCERNGMSWIVWQDRKPTDQLSAVMNYLIPDAIAKKYAWWTNTETQTPRKPAKLHSRSGVPAGSRTVLANGQVVRGQAETTHMNQLSIWRMIINADR
jgi:hypothetical protein